MRLSFSCVARTLLSFAALISEYRRHHSSRSSGASARRINGQHAGELASGEQRVSGNMRQAGLAGKFKIITAKGGEHNIFNRGFVVGDLAHCACTGSGIIQPMRSVHALRVCEVARAGRAIPEPEFGASSVKITDQHFQHACRQVFPSAA